MAYTPQDFENGNILMADHLKKMEDGTTGAVDGAFVENPRIVEDEE